jgi:hypothetical protein
MKSKTIDVLKAERNEKERDDVGGVGAQNFYFFFPILGVRIHAQIEKEAKFFCIQQKAKNYMAWLFRYTDSLGRCCARCLCYFSSRLVIRFIQIVRVPSPQRTHSNRTGLAS